MSSKQQEPGNKTLKVATPILNSKSDFKPLADGNKLKSSSQSIQRVQSSSLSIIFSLLKKNWVMKWKVPLAFLLEIFAPMLFIFAMNKATPRHGSASDVNVPTGFSVDSQSYNLFESFSFVEMTLSGLLLHLAAFSVHSQSLGDYANTTVSSDCISKVATKGFVSIDSSSSFATPQSCLGEGAIPYKIAIVPDDKFTRDYFAATINQWHPTLSVQMSSDRISSEKVNVTIPSFKDSSIFFSSENELEDYVLKEENSSKGNIYAAIVFRKYPTDVSNFGKFSTIEYSLRLANETGVPTTFEHNGATAWNADARNMETINLKKYSSSGFLTLQTMVTKFAACMPQWDASSNSPSISKCQGENSIAKETSDLKTQLLQAVGRDPAIQLAYRLALKELPTNNTCPECEIEVSSNKQDDLLKPLYQLPQPILGVPPIISPFPIESYYYSKFHVVAEDLLPAFFIISYVWTLAKMIESLCVERETRARELLQILGVSNSTILVSWYVTYILLLFVLSLVQSWFAVYTVYALFHFSSFPLLFTFFFLFSLSLLAFAFLVSSIFAKTRTATFVGVIMLLAMFAISLAFNNDSSEASRNIACLFSPVGLAFGAKVLVGREAVRVGLHPSNASQLYRGFRFTTSLWYFVVDAILYTALGIYFENVMPKGYGKPKKWYFLFQSSYWKPEKPNANFEDTSNSLHENLLQNDAEVRLEFGDIVEPVGSDLKHQEKTGQLLKLQNIRKVFRCADGTEKVAVRDLSLNIYAGQITCLLGHNGAGKTTLMSMLSGVIPPTSGDAFFQRNSIRHNMAAIRASLGICFQYDVLYPDLTVYDHLLFYARIKGFRGKHLKAEVARKIQEVGLTDMKKYSSKKLSGGMKRRLSLAIAMLGDPSLVILDEPTSGLDPYARRSVWDILLNKHKDRVLILCTHLMDEADALGDRIAIMSDGELRCCGSPLYLKRTFGSGYNLIFAKGNATVNTNAYSDHDAEIIQFVRSYVPTAKLLSNVGTEMSFQLPLESSSAFAAMFEKLEEEGKCEQLEVISYGISVTTMDEVFLNLIEVESYNEKLDGELLENENVGPEEVSRVVLSPSFSQQFKALVKKRYHVAKRDKLALCVSVLLPVMWLLLGFLLLHVQSLYTNIDMSLQFNRALLESPAIPVVISCEESNDNWCKQLSQNKDYLQYSTEYVSDESQLFSEEKSVATLFGVDYQVGGSNNTGLTATEKLTLQLSDAVLDRAINDNGEQVMQFGGYIMSTDANQNTLSFNIMANTTLPHGSAVLKADMDQSIIRLMANGKVSDIKDVNLVVSNFPLPHNNVEPSFLVSQSMNYSYLIVLALMFYPPSIVAVLTKERDSHQNAKQLQYTSGVGMNAYWLANMLWDATVFLLPMVFIAFLIFVFDVAPLVGSSDCKTCTSSTFVGVVILLVLYGIAMCPCSYVLSFIFSDYKSCQQKVILANFFLGLVLAIIETTLADHKGLENERIILYTQYLFRFSPLYNVATGLFTLSKLPNDPSASKDVFTDLNLGLPIKFLAADTILYYLFTLFIDLNSSSPNLNSRITPQGVKEIVWDDEDVQAEENRILAGGEAVSNDILKIQALGKNYPEYKLAVKKLSLGLKQGECFGFLGVNGAGKSTTMNMLTGQIASSWGNAEVCGFNMLTQQRHARKHIGYCPQYDALLDLMTVREHLELYANLKGVPSGLIENIVKEKMEQLDLVNYENKISMSLSGGTKRKLSVAIAMIGSPEVLLLDEPSKGMDPLSKRFMWNIITEVSTIKKESAILLSTHSMEECEAICTRVGVMVNGGLKCLGSVQHLKSRFGDGLMLAGKIKEPEPWEISDFITQNLNRDSSEQRISLDQLEETCRLLGESSWIDKITDNHQSGFIVSKQIDLNGFVTIQAFAHWWISEMRFEALNEFLSTSFDDSVNVELAERQSESCLFKLSERVNEDGDNKSPDRSTVVKLSKIFDAMEEKKEQLFVQEYSISQTTLEQIFNSFASTQAIDDRDELLPTIKTPGMLR